MSHTDSAQAAGQLRLIQRSQAKQIVLLRIALLTTSLLLLMVGYEVWRPTELTSVSSPASNLIPGGLPEKESQIGPALLQARQDSEVAAVFDYFNIDSRSLGELTKKEVIPNDTDLAAVTRRALGGPLETQHAFANHTFYDSPFKDVLAQPHRSTVIYEGEIGQTTDQARTGMRGRTFAIHPQSGMILFEKTTDASVSGRIFRDTPTIQPNGTAQLFFALEFSGAGTVQQPRATISTPDGLEIQTMQTDSAITIEGSGETLEARSLLGELSGNRTYWIEATVTTTDEFLGETLCAEMSVESSVSSSPFSDSQCLVVTSSADEVASSCERNQNGSFMMTGLYSQITDQVCLEAFSDSLFTAITADTDTGGGLPFTITHTNFGSNEITAPNVLSLADALEYAAVGELQAAQLIDQEAIWPNSTIAPGEQEIYMLRLSLRSPLASTPTTATDATSYDGIISLTSNGATIYTPLDTDLAFDLSEVSRFTAPIGSEFSLGLLALIVLFLAVNYAHTVSVHNTAQHERRKAHGGMHI